MKEMIEKMNKVLTDWKNQFDLTVAAELEFDTNETGTLCLNKVAIHLPKELQLASSAFDGENIKFYFTNTRKLLNIGMGWPEDGTPYVDTVRFGYANEM